MRLSFEGPRSTAAFQFALAQQQLVAQLQVQCDTVQRLLINQIGAMTGKFAFAQVRKFFEQLESNRAIDHAVTEKFQPFVMCRSKRAVGQRPPKQPRLFEAMSNACTDGFRIHGGRITVMPATVQNWGQIPCTH